MHEEKRMAGDYEIIQAIMIGDKEIVIGENQADINGQKYMTAVGEWNDLFEFYDQVLVSDDYPEIVGYFGQRVTEQAKKTRDELFRPNLEGIDNTVITSDDCTAITHDDDLNGRIIVIKPEVLRREYRRATNQIKLCKGGFGASPNSRGSAVYCKDLYTGKESRYERRDVLGTLEPDMLPKWARPEIVKIVQDDKKKERNKEER
jgi:hypothetical protein